MSMASIVIPSYRSIDTIERCLLSVLTQRADIKHEIIVVDSSGDETPEYIAQRFPNVRLIARSSRVSSGTARNIGVEAAFGEIILFLDSDCTVGPRWLESMVAAYESGEWDAVAGSVMNGNPQSAVSWASYITEFSEYMPVGAPRERISSPTCNISYRREVFRDCGGFDEQLRMYVDYEFNGRIRRHGKRLLFDPSITVRHWHRTSLRDYLRHEMKRGRAAVMLRRSGLLPRSWVVRSRPMCAIAAPLAMARRVITDIRRFVPAGMVTGKELGRILPSFVLGSCMWGTGFLLEGLQPPSKAYAPERGRELRLS